MLLDLSPIVNVDGKKLRFEKTIDFSDRCEVGVVFLSPCEISGGLANIGGSIELSAKVSTRLRFACDRCCEEFEVDFECSFEEVLKKEDVREESDDNPDVLYFRGNSIELDDIVLNNIIVSLPVKRLCREDCKGLCPDCGKNLNTGECSCDTRPTDPRFDILDKFFE